MLQRQDFYFDLPSELIAQQPPAQRGDSRLLALDGATGQVADQRFSDLLELLRPDDLLVFNDTRVIPARLSGRKASGGRVELLVERVLDEQRALVQIRANRAPKPGSLLVFDAGGTAIVVDRQQDLFEIRVDIDQPLPTWLEQHGRLPLPPYITREPTAHDAERYQTVYARQPGAVAAPTAGLHFDQALLTRISEMGVASTFITLHVGAGTFQPIRMEQITEHVMHAERFAITPETCEQIRATQERGGRVIAVGTTTLRALETASDEQGVPQPGPDETRIFIYPGYRFRCVDALITNFHLPESTLLMLVAAFAGRAAILEAYRHAVAAGYRFFSYGDAMFITRAPHN
ncbi:MAG: tRNA preQ1(34) S-adenosylmethionine ribosyltransferase-isomerase QueA [Candidatus Competibacter denitrificans]|jgi:S-adenosylmethionine:tRNA ribosyltransferase-isomerase|uniref:S-adenosylmethionine:tRNA ribosyltransferase-isomerase n=1 Tax=Candidatus Competibacter denitrificans Run_A_D11 TaxID=1400863 RepID=W6M7X1_9GAMM|nr:tRNA preQ1(34) S-adenosylmethionine ribosyltransferase-isomerase QueA [Candidatus Competibacter denitrificans]CDI02699.1 S-adenosylmethionine:tRNA ribosyltransferase-isomerase [Candidatus Competibacter denitrificans Run_A_D11]HAS86331.1 S-adenosylmethionine:tRNA ribosyltransferase-isomerase [Candidatus Competibacteraceae bacterium]HRC69944.1 tRNA preQ1(34) S-adenosylmethionine ribosyltransferase-isomerase QueA [Candidatus Competibacter denitrificans]